jgi:cation diffusion facilitator family transporter
VPVSHHTHADHHGHSHGVVDPSIVRSHAGVRAVALSLAVLAVTATVQTVIYTFTSSVSLLADLIHNFGDASTAIPLGAAFLLRSAKAERWSGLAVVLAILASACVALVQTIMRFIHPQHLTHLWWLAAAGVIGFAGNEVAARIRTRAGKRLDSPALVADGDHARADGYVSLAVLVVAGAAAIGWDRVDPVIGLVITLVILRITWQAWHTIRGHH